MNEEAYTRFLFYISLYYFITGKCDICNLCGKCTYVYGNVWNWKF